MNFSFKREEISIMMDALSELNQQILDKTARGFDELRQYIKSIFQKISVHPEVPEKLKKYAEEVLREDF